MHEAGSKISPHHPRGALCSFSFQRLLNFFPPMGDGTMKLGGLKRLGSQIIGKFSAQKIFNELCIRNSIDVFNPEFC